MKFNEPVNTKDILVKAIEAKPENQDKNEEEKDDKIVEIEIQKDFNSTEFIRDLSEALLNLKGKNITFDLNSFLDVAQFNDKFALTCAIFTKIEAFLGKSFNMKKEAKFGEVNVIFRDEFKEIVEKAQKVADSVETVRQLQIMPFNYLGTNQYIAEINKLFTNFANNVKIKVLRGYEIKIEGMELLDAVNAGSQEEPALVVIQYFNNPESQDKIALVGKGIMYDSGGYDIKPLRAMEYMNQDMTGSTIALGTVLALAKTNAKVNVIAVLPLASNLINERSMQWGNIYKSITGRTVEMTCADAEGRLVLADAIGYVDKYYKPTKIFTIATLTGLSEVAFGEYLVPYWTTNKENIPALSKAGEQAGEYYLSLPLFKDYYKIINESSEVADCRNVWDTTGADNGIAAAFLKEFCECKDFTHFDMMGAIKYKKQILNPMTLMLYFFAVNYWNK